MQNELLNEGLTLMLAGMGTVFAFLTVLVMAMTVMSRILTRWQSNVMHDSVSDDELAAIAAAVTKHRRQ